MVTGTVDEGDAVGAPDHAGCAGLDGDLTLALDGVGVEELSTFLETVCRNGTGFLKETIAERTLSAG